MTNWNANSLLITGSTPALVACLASMGSPESEDDDDKLFDLDRIAPMPPEVRASIEGMDLASLVFGNGPVTEAWKVAHWGSERPAWWVSIRFRRDGTGALVKFDTAKSPIQPIVKELSRRFPTLT